VADHPDLDATLSRIDAAGDELAGLTSRLVQLPTVNPPGDTTDAVALLHDYFRDRGVAAEAHELVPGKANLRVVVPGRGEGTLLWVGHIDVVPEGNGEAWERGPFSGAIEGGRVHGRGATDMKGACAAAALVATLLDSLGARLAPSVEFWFTCDEEVGGTDGARRLAAEGLFRGDAAIIGDGWNGAQPGLDIGCRGGMGTTLRVRSRGGHGSRPFLGDNAFEKLERVVPFVKRLEEFRLEVPEELHAVLLGSGADMAENAGLSGEAAERAGRFFFYPSVSLNIVRAGVKSNVIPDEAEATFDIRLSPGSDRERVRARLLELLDASGVDGVSVEVRGAPANAGAAAPVGYYEPPDHPFVRHMSGAVRRVTGQTPRLKVLSGGTDGVALHHIAGIPSVGFGAGLPELAHGVNEYVTVANLVRAARVYAAAALLFQKPVAAK
jgi:succinyl-diaminopimelate desuccinylase